MDHADYYNSESLKKKSTEEDFVVFEELIHGKIVLNSDGQFFVQIRGDVADLSFSESDSIKLIENNGQQTLFIEKREEHDYCSREEFFVNKKGKEVKNQQVHSHQSAALFHDSDEQFDLNEDEVIALDNVDFGGEEIVSTTTENSNLTNNRKQNKRVFGTNKCSECGQSFTNMARLERHLSVHQCFGAYVCPLCGKTYKYEYNLFYHWRRTCRDLNEMIPVEERKAIEINALRHLIEDISKKHSLDHLEYSKHLSNSVYSKQRQKQQNEFLEDQQNLKEQSEQNDFMFVYSGNDLTSNLQTFRNNLTQTQFVEDNIDVFSEQGTSSNSVNCLKCPYNQSDQFKKSVQSLQCTECLRSFSSIQRLQKHLISSHYSTGTHPCLFCGNRFKYEYNLFFHYRNVCPYSLELLNEENRRQLDASNLKKLIRQIATDKNFYLKSPPLKIQNNEEQLLEEINNESNNFSLIEKNAAENGDSAMRRQMMKKIIKKYTPKVGNKFIKNNFDDSIEHKKGEEEDQQQQHLFEKVQLPPGLLQPSYRPDLPEGIKCPICSVVFYGLKIIIRHLKAAHPKESSIWEKTILGLEEEEEGKNNKNNNKISKNITKICPSRFLTKLTATKKRRREQQELLVEEQNNINEDYSPPLLEVEQ